MVSSMTGYGRGEASGAGKTVTVEMKSVNHRFLEIMVRLPRLFNVFEEKIKSIIKDHTERGRIDVYINIEETREKKRNLNVDKELAIAYYNSLKELAKILDIGENLGVLAIAQMPEVLKLEEPEEDCETFWPIIKEALVAAVAQMQKMRREEGQKLKADLLVRKDLISRYVADIEHQAAQVVEEYRTKLTARIQELLGSIPVDENRLALEIALLADRASITEELVRLNSHLDQLQNALAEGGSVGRKLDFLVQEMHREINTIGSKANNLQISNKVVTVKSEIEKIREQVQNLE